MAIAAQQAPPSSFPCSDLHHAAFLLSKNTRLTGLQRQGSRTLFVFSDRDRCEELLRDLMNGASVSATAFIAALRDLKTLLHDQFRNNGDGNLKGVRSHELPVAQELVET